MKIFNSPLPSRKTVLLLFVAVAFPIHLWAIIITLLRVPAYLLHLSLAQTLGVLAYTFTAILLESVAGTLIFWPFALLFKEKIIAQAAALMPIALATTYIAQTRDYESVFKYQAYLKITDFARIWAVGLIVIAIAGYLVHRFPKLADFLIRYVDRTLVLTLIYVALDLIAALTLIGRNLL